MNNYEVVLLFFLHNYLKLKKSICVTQNLIHSLKKLANLVSASELIMYKYVSTLKKQLQIVLYATVTL